MPREEIPITPLLVTWARKRAGLTIQEATQKFNNIEAWEAGEAFPTYPQLEKLADEFKLPIAVFFFPEPPELPPIRDSFRTLPDAQFQQLPRRVGFLLRKAKAFQLNLAELCQGRNPAQRLITRALRFPDNVAIETMTVRVRDYLAITLADQCAWPDDDTALRTWRRALLSVGIFVFKDAFKVDEYSGFCLDDSEFPIIYVNNSSAKTRQIFTLFHELAHLLFHTSGVDALDDSYIAALANRPKRIEILCNRFAAQFLVPETEFENAFAGHDPSERTAESLAAHFHVSREFIYRKFLDRGLIEEESYTRAVERWAARRKEGGGGNPYRTRISYLGRDYIALALKQYHQNRIDDVQLGEYLDTKPKHLAAFEEYFSTGSQ